MAIKSYNNNFIVGQDPNAYGGQQEDYLKRTAEAVEHGIAMVESAKREKKDLIQTYYAVENYLATVRHDIAVAHGTEDAHLFGRLRTDCVVSADMDYLILCNNYQTFNDRLIQTLRIILAGALPVKGEPPQKKWNRETTCLGRKCALSVEILSQKDLVAREWNRELHSKYSNAVLSIPRDKDLDNIEDRIDEKNFPPTLEEQQLIDKFNAYKDVFRTTFPDLHLHPHMNFCISALNGTFPHSVEVEGKGSVLVPENCKTHIIVATARIQLGGAMCDLTRYITWAFQDGKTDPIERLKTAKIMMLHHDCLSIKKTTAEIAPLFAKAVALDMSVHERSELFDLTAQIRYLSAHVMRYNRGSASIAEMMEKIILRVQGLECEHNGKTLGDMEAFIAPLLSKFRTVYESTFSVVPKKEPVDSGEGCSST